MRTALATEHLRVTPGVPTIFEVEVTNTANVIDGVTAVIDGLDPAWVQLVEPVVSLFPESTGTIVARLDLPSNCVAGDYLITVRVASTIDPERSSTHQFWLTVEPITGCDIRVRPSSVTGGTKTEFAAFIANTGNVPTQVVVRAEEDTRAVSCLVEPPAITVAPGTIEMVRIAVKGPRPWFGQSASRSIVITAATPTEELPVLATFTQKPRIPRGLLTFVILAGIIALWAFIFIVVIAALRSDATPKKAVPEHFENGVTDVPLKAIAGSAAGSVTAVSTEEGVARVTVEALRQTADGSTLIASAATGDDGSYLIETLLPGSYKLRFTGEGFNEIWYPAATSEDAAEVVAIDPQVAKAGLDVAIGGKAGTFLGSILAPEGAGTVTIRVILTMVVEGAVEGTEQPTAEIETSGPIDIGGLVAPATYRFLVKSDGFEDLEFEEKLGAGETKVLNTVTLGAALGSITGRTVDGNGNPLGGVRVVVSSGEFVKEATTPTEGQVGAYVIDGLETPNTYVVTFIAEGFATVSLALDLPAGATPTGVDARLTGGVGTATGTVVSVDGLGLGGIKIAVAGGLFTAESETLTTGVVGSFLVAGMPTPGTFTLTFSADGYLPETRLVTFGGPGTQGGVDVVLRPSTGTLTGTVSTSGVASSAVEVKLRNGVDTRVTETASTPAGAYSFTQVMPGTYTLTFTKSGYVVRILLVRVVAGDALIFDVDLPAVAP